MIKLVRLRNPWGCRTRGGRNKFAKSQVFPHGNNDVAFWIVDRCRQLLANPLGGGALPDPDNDGGVFFLELNTFCRLLKDFDHAELSE
jgi:hypothetical protein